MGAAALAVIAAGVLATVTWDRNATWRDPVTFYTDMFTYDVISARAHNNLAMAYADRLDFPDAVAEYKKAIEISDSYSETRFNLSLAYLHQPDWKEHLPDIYANLQRSIEIDPNFYRSYQLLGQIYQLNGENAKAGYYREKGDELLRKSGIVRKLSSCR